MSSCASSSSPPSAGLRPGASGLAEKRCVPKSGHTQQGRPRVWRRGTLTPVSQPCAPTEPLRNRRLLVWRRGILSSAQHGDDCLTHRPADDDSAADRLSMKRHSLGEDDRLTDRIMANIEQLPDGWEDISDVASSMSVWTCSSGESHEDIQSPEHTPSAEGILGLISRVSTGASQPSNLQSLGSKDLTSQLGVGISK